MDEIVEIMARAMTRFVRPDAAEAAQQALTALHNQGYAVVKGWQPIETAPKAYHPPLSHYNHHAPEILGLWGQAFYSVCSWGGPAQPFWIGGDNKKTPFQPTRWMPLPVAPSPTDGASVDPAKVRHINTPTDTGKEGA